MNSEAYLCLIFVILRVLLYDRSAFTGLRFKNWKVREARYEFQGLNLQGERQCSILRPERVAFQKKAERNVWYSRNLNGEIFDPNTFTKWETPSTSTPTYTVNYMQAESAAVVIKIQTSWRNVIVISLRIYASLLWDPLCGSKFVGAWILKDISDKFTNLLICMYRMFYELWTLP